MGNACDMSRDAFNQLEAIVGNVEQVVSCFVYCHRLTLCRVTVAEAGMQGYADSSRLRLAIRRFDRGAV